MIVRRTNARIDYPASFEIEISSRESRRRGGADSPAVVGGVERGLVDGHPSYHRLWWACDWVHVGWRWLRSCSCGDSLVGRLDAVDCFVVVDVVGCSLVVVVVV